MSGHNVNLSAKYSILGFCDFFVHRIFRYRFLLLMDLPTLSFASTLQACPALLGWSSYISGNACFEQSEGYFFEFRILAFLLKIVLEAAHRYWNRSCHFIDRLFSIDEMRLERVGYFWKRYLMFGDALIRKNAIMAKKTILGDKGRKIATTPTMKNKIPKLIKRIRFQTGVVLSICSDSYLYLDITSAASSTAEGRSLSLLIASVRLCLLASIMIIPTLRKVVIRGTIL